MHSAGAVLEPPAASAMKEIALEKEKKRNKAVNLPHSGPIFINGANLGKKEELMKVAGAGDSLPANGEKQNNYHVMKKDEVSNPLQFVYMEDYFDEYINFKSDLGE